MPVAPPDRDTGSSKRRRRPRPAPVRVPPSKAAQPTPEPRRGRRPPRQQPIRVPPSKAAAPVPRERPRPAYRLPPRKHSIAVRDRGLARAERFKRTAGYRKAVEDVYDSLDAAQRARLLKATRGTREGKIIAKHHVKMQYPVARLGEGPYTDRQRIRNAEFKTGEDFRKALIAGKMAAARAEVKRRGGADKITVDERDPFILAAAGFHEDFLDKVMSAPYGLLASGAVGAAATGVAAYHDPVGVPTKTLHQLGEAALALPGAAVETVRHPIKTAEEGFEGMESRANESFKARVGRIRKEGAISDIADASILIPGAGVVAKPLASTLLKLAIPGAPKHLPTRAARVVSGGKMKTPKEGGLLRLSTGAAKDKVVARQQLRAVERAEAGGDRVDPLVRQAVEMNREAGRVVAVAQGRLTRKGKITREVAKARARGVFGLKRELELRTKTARKLHDRLRPPEKRAFYYGAVFGIRTPAQAVDVLGKARAMIVAERERAGGWEPQGAQKRADMLPDIDAILESPETHFTPRLAQTLDAITPDSLRAGREDPRLEIRQGDLRRHAPLAEVLDLHRGELPPLPEGVAAELPDGSHMLARAPEPEPPKMIVKPKPRPETAWFNPRPLAKNAKAGRGFIDADGKLHTWDEEHGTHEEIQRARGVNSVGDVNIRPDGTVYPTGGVARPGKALLASEAEVIARAISQDRRLKPPENVSRKPDADPPFDSRENLYQALERVLPEYRDEVPAPADIPDLSPVDDIPDLSPVDDIPAMRLFDEDPDAYLARIQEAVRREGLAEPIYFRSERFADEPDFAARTVGGSGRMAEDATYKGSNLRLGLQDTGFSVYLNGLARNVKAKHNKRLVDDLLNEHVIAKYNGDGMQNLLQLRDALTRDGVDLQAVGFWNPGIYRTQLARLADDIPEELADAADSPTNLDAFRAATSPAAADTPGWKVLPIAAQRELEAQMVPSNVAGRAYDIGKGWSSRMILLTGNVPWLGAQVVQNMLGGAAGTGGKALLPTNWVGAWRNWRKLDDDERARIGGVLGLDATAADATRHRMGGQGGTITKAYRTLHDWSGWHKGVARGRGPSVSSLNPVQVMAKMDRMQNNASRVVIWHTLLKREQVRKLGAEMGHLDHLQMRAMAALGKDMGEARLRRDPELLERIGEQTTKVLGDFATLTSFERKFLGRAFMFYPFVRFSTRLAFYTLPVDHPIIAGLTAEIAHMEAEDRKELFGDSALRWTGGKAYLGDGKAIDFAKLNPLGNAVFSALSEDRPSALIGVAPPFVGALWNQASSEDYFTGKMQHYQGDPSKAYQQGVSHLPLVNGTRARIAAADVLGLSAGYRALRNMEINPAEGFRHDTDLEGYQGADSLIFAPAPVEFGHTTKDAKLREKFAARNEEVRESNDSWIAQFIPFLPENERDAARAREQIVLEKAEKPKKKPRKGASEDYKFGGGSSGYKFGGG